VSASVWIGLDGLCKHPVTKEGRQSILVKQNSRGPRGGGFRLHDTLVVGLEPDVPPALVSSDVDFWFRWGVGVLHRFLKHRAR
jgi:hypothetical protein